MCVFSGARFSDLACGGGWSCFLSPLSKCKVEDLDRAKGEWGLVLNYHFRDEYHVVSMDHFCEPHGHYNVTHGPSRALSRYPGSYFAGCSRYATSNDLRFV